jgi:hypothetical protein
VRVNAVAVTEGAFLGSGGGGTTFVNGTADNPNGSLHSVAAALSGMGPTVSGSGVLAHIGFIAIALGATNVVLSNIQLLDSTLTQIEFLPSISGTVQVVPEPGTVVLLALGGTLLGARRRRSAPSRRG